MIKYILMEGSIRDRETNSSIPIAEDNRHYQEFLEWLGEFNLPVEKSPGDYYELIGDKWVENIERKIKAGQQELIQAEMRKLAIQSLKAQNKLPIDYKEVEISDAK